MGEDTVNPLEAPNQRGYHRGMQEDFDKVVEEIQASVMEEARKVYSERVIEWWLDPTYMGDMENPQGSGTATGSCGDTMHLFLRIEDGKITDARFLTNGCATTIAAGCMACELAIGRTYKEALKISQEVILEELGGLPEESIHCALLASDTLRKALTDSLASRNEP
jgi:nitrogen fixation NifU-like protein